MTTETETSLFDHATSQLARRVAARKASKRYQQIAEALADGPRCIFEIAEVIGCHDHQISGRFGELVDLGLLTKTGDRRRKPGTGCWCDLYAIAGDIDSAGDPPQDGVGDA